MKFTIRDVLWLTLVVALACGWAMHANDLNRRAKRERMNATKLALWVTMLGKDVDYGSDGEVLVK